MSSYNWLNDDGFITFGKEPFRLVVGTSYMDTSHNKIEILGKWDKLYLVFRRSPGPCHGDIYWVYDEYGEPLRGCLGSSLGRLIGYYSNCTLNLQKEMKNEILEVNVESCNGNPAKFAETLLKYLVHRFNIRLEDHLKDLRVFEEYLRKRESFNWGISTGFIQAEYSVSLNHDYKTIILKPTIEMNTYGHGEYCSWECNDSDPYAC
jgi:hypothetical protein